MKIIMQNRPTLEKILFFVLSLSHLILLLAALTRTKSSPQKDELRIWRITAEEFEDETDSDGDNNV